MANNNQNFVPADTYWILKKLPMKASTAMIEGAAIGTEIVSNTTTGYNTLMGTENAAGADFVGILAEPIAATDSDYATAGKLKAVYVPTSRQARCEFKVGAGTFSAVDVGKTVEFHSDSASLAVDTAGKGAKIVEFINANRGVCVFDLPLTETA